MIDELRLFVATLETDRVLSEDIKEAYRVLWQE
jgi:hypothetical protein